MKLRRYHTPSPMAIVPADTLCRVRDQWARDTPTKIQTVLKKISRSGGGAPHMSVKLPMPGGERAVYLYRYSYPIVYRGDVFVQKRSARHNTSCGCCFITGSTRSTCTTQKTHA